MHVELEINEIEAIEAIVVAIEFISRRGKPFFASGDKGFRATSNA